MITTDISSLFLDVKREQLITEHTRLPAGGGIIVDGQVKYVVVTNFKPVPNKDLIRKAEEHYSITWKYAHFDNAISNFAFCGLIDDIIKTDIKGHAIQLGIEIVNSYNQRSGADINYCFYNRTRESWIKTNVSLLNDDVDTDTLFRVLFSLQDIQFGITDIPNYIPVKLTRLIISEMDGSHDAYDFIFALGTISRKHWEYSSYELSRKASAKLFKELTGG